MLEIVNPITGEPFRVAQKDFEFKMTWWKAKQICEELGNGWRLPSKSEIEQINKQLHLKGQGDFKNNKYYWTITEIDANTAITINLMDMYLDDEGWYTGNKKDIECYVRAVRPL